MYLFDSLYFWAFNLWLMCEKLK